MIRRQNSALLAWIFCWVVIILLLIEAGMTYIYAGSTKTIPAAINHFTSTLFYIVSAIIGVVAVIAVLLLVSAPVRLMIPNISGFLATTIPIAMSIGATTGVNPVICGLAVMIAGDAVLYYPAQSASSQVVYERGHLTAFEALVASLAAVDRGGRLRLWERIVGDAG